MNINLILEEVVMTATVILTTVKNVIMIMVRKFVINAKMDIILIKQKNVLNVQYKVPKGKYLKFVQMKSLI